MVGMEQISGTSGQMTVEYPHSSANAGQVVTTAEPGHKADSVDISFQAKEISKAVSDEKSEAQLKAEQERIAEARKHIEEGAYRVQQVILQVASRMTRMVPGTTTEQSNVTAG